MTFDSSMDEKSVKHLVVDSGAFIKNAPIKDVAEVIYTLRDVVSEIRDKVTRQRLQVLPYQIHFKEPSPEAIKLVTDFSKKTGDYPSLSAVDIRVIALLYQLEKEHVGADHIKVTPEKNITWTTTRSQLEKVTSIAGFYLDKKPSSSRSTSVCESQNEASTDTQCTTNMSDSLPAEPSSPADIVDPAEPSTPVEIANPAADVMTKDDQLESEAESSDTPGQQGVTTHMEVVDSAFTADVSQQDEAEQSNRYLADGDILDHLEEEDQEEDSEEDEDEEDEDGWITPSNIKSIRTSMGAPATEIKQVPVGCMTTDFAMQNVLIQMGLNVVSVDGMLIKHAKSYVLRCYGCNKITKNMMKEFCFHCGNKTLQKVSMTVNEDGSIRYFLSKRRPITTRGSKYSIPNPQGGKHANNPHLVEDQPFPQQRVNKHSRQIFNMMEADHVPGESPFFLTDTTSRAALLGIRNRTNNSKSRRNPNESRKFTGRRK